MKRKLNIPPFCDRLFSVWWWCAFSAESEATFLFSLFFLSFLQKKKLKSHSPLNKLSPIASRTKFWWLSCLSRQPNFCLDDQNQLGMGGEGKGRDGGLVIYCTFNGDCIVGKMLKLVSALWRYGSEAPQCLLLTKPTHLCCSLHISHLLYCSSFWTIKFAVWTTEGLVCPRENQEKILSLSWKVSCVNYSVASFLSYPISNVHTISTAIFEAHKQVPILHCALKDVPSRVIYTLFFPNLAGKSSTTYF